MHTMPSQLTEPSTFDTGALNYDLDLSAVIYNSVMANIDDRTTITVDSTSKEITNVSVKKLETGFDLWLFHATKITGNHVDEAEIVGSWHFESLDHFDKMVEKLRTSSKK